MDEWRNKFDLKAQLFYRLTVVSENENTTPHEVQKCSKNDDEK
jgi:hypothetical protein